MIELESRRSYKASRFDELSNSSVFKSAILFSNSPGKFCNSPKYHVSPRPHYINRIRCAGIYWYHGYEHGLLRVNVTRSITYMVAVN